MADISLSDFVDYVSKSGTTKFSKVKEINRRDVYHPAFDFWKKLREAIIELHKNGNNKSDLTNILDGLNEKKIVSYTKNIKQYQSFLGRKTIEWFDPLYKIWSYEGLNVRLNPELGLEINGKLYVLKLWFKAEKLSKSKAELIILLMNEKLKEKNYKDVNFAVLDVSNKKLFENTKLTSDEFALLEAEAVSFIKIWNNINK